MNMVNENNGKFKDIPLKIYNPEWSSELASIIIELETLRKKVLGGPVPPYIFFQLKDIFQLLESLASARVEGNNTTLSDFVDRIISDQDEKKKDEKTIEILNIDQAIRFINENVNKETKFDRALLSEIHKILVRGLTPPPKGEGSRFPGQLRPHDVIINKSKHVPPEHIKVLDYFDELMDFVNCEMGTQYHLLSIALAHHRMSWIHPFDNGNGRFVRIFTYAMLIKQGFQVKNGRILNPTAIFCIDRNKYYDMLALADTGEEEKVLQWCEYVLGGLKLEIEKIDKLLDINYVINDILLPVLNFALKENYITNREFNILVATVKNRDMQIRSSDLEKITGVDSAVQRSRIFKKLREKNMLKPISANGRIYTIGFSNSYLLRGTINILTKNGFISESLNSK